MRSPAASSAAHSCWPRSTSRSSRLPACRCSSPRSWASPNPSSMSARALPRAGRHPLHGSETTVIQVNERRPTMEVILLERVAKLGQMGEVVRVKDGFARNFLLPRGKALRATDENRKRFEKMKVELEARNLEQKGEAEKVGSKLNGQSFTVLRQAAEGGQLYGPGSPRGLPRPPTAKGFRPSPTQNAPQNPVKTSG